MDVFVFRLSLLLWISYNTRANSTFSVYINGSISHELNGTMQITCTVFGFTVHNVLQFEIELHQRRNYNITRLVKSTPSRLEQTDDKYCWKTSITEDNITQKYNVTVQLYVNNSTYKDEEIYTCYATVNSVTRFRSIMIPDVVNKTSYVIIRSMDVLFKNIPDACCKYGYTIFEDDSVLNEIQLLQNESAYFPVWPKFNTSNQNVTLAKPWVSYEEITLHQVDTKEMNTECEAMYIDIQTSKLHRIPCYGSSRCDVFCINQDGSNASAHGHKKWNDARNICNNLNTSLPGLNSTFITMERARIINCTICLAVVQTSSIAFQPIIKQITKGNDGIISTSIPRNGSQKLPFVCKDNKDIEKLIPLVCDSHSSLGEIKEFPTISTENPSARCTANEVTSDVSLQPNNRTEGSNSKVYGIMVIISSVVASLVTLVVLCVIVRKRISQGNGNVRTDTELKTNIHTAPTEEWNENHRGNDEDIQLEEMYSTAEETDSSHIKRCSKRHGDNKNTEDEDLGEYDVLRGKRQNEEAPQSENIYDRTNNAVSGIYDSTSTQPVVDIYTI
uniref:Uncharacterized protein LOC111127909 isoform X3 n=1 Tax=Crassostrea virginica TaxID=6565 RepID=A0A8B8DPN7_CRAVI|nr:uncharacterized protein LOC111127909 isoform X3 [Crassostrea virginica]